MNFYRHCPGCGQIENIYKKKIRINGREYFYPNKFYVCQNPKCCLYVNLENEKKSKFCLVDDFFFEWVLVFDHKNTLDNQKNI